MTHRKLLCLIMAPIVAVTLLLMSGVILAYGPASFPGHAGSNPQQTAGSASYRVAMLGDMTTTNYWAYLGRDSTVWNGYVLGNFVHSLFGYSAQRADWIPLLAADFPSELSQEGDLWVSTVTLKQGVHWSDGTEVTAEDVAFTVNTVVELELGRNWESIYDPAFLDRVEAADTYVAKFFFKEKPGVARWQFGAAMGPILPKHYWDSIVAEAKTQPDPEAWLYNYVPEGEPTAGPFVFNEWVPDSHVDIVYNPHYYRQGAQIKEYANGAFQETLPGEYEFSAYGVATGTVDLSLTVGPHVRSVHYELLTEDSAVQALRNGELDFILTSSGLPVDTCQSLDTEPNITTVSNPSNGFRYMGFNFRRFPMEVPAFRTAVATLIDREFPGTVVEENASPVWTVVPEGNTYWYNPEVPHIGEGLTRQERISETVDLLTTAGFTWTVQPVWDPVSQEVVAGQGLHHEGTPVPEIELLTPSWDPLRTAAGLNIEQWLNEAGISATAVVTDGNTLIGRVFGEQDFDMYIMGWGLGRFPNHLCTFFQSDGGLNPLGYSNPTLDAKCDEFLAETDIAQARDDAWELQAILAEDLPYVTLFEPELCEAYRSDRIAFPYTETLGGVQGANGMPALVKRIYKVYLPLVMTGD